MNGNCSCVTCKPAGEDSCTHWVTPYRQCRNRGIGTYVVGLLLCATHKRLLDRLYPDDTEAVWTPVVRERTSRAN